MKTKSKEALRLITIFSVLVGLSACQSEQSPPESSKKASNRLANVEQDVDAILAKMTLPEKVSLTHASGKFHVNAIERVGIPEMWLSDGPHGVRHQIERHTWASAGWTDDHATYLPHLTSVAASWDKNMASLHGKVLGAEARERKKILF